jgi:hypothetical protein
MILCLIANCELFCDNIESRHMIEKIKKYSLSYKLIKLGSIVIFLVDLPFEIIFFGFYQE